MGSLPVLKPREVIKLLENWDLLLCVNADHKGRDISPFLLRQIARDIEVPIEYFLRAK